MNPISPKKYRLKSITPMGKILLTIEELNHPGELRLWASDVVQKKEMLAGFDKVDLARILYAAESGF